MHIACTSIRVEQRLCRSGSYEPLTAYCDVCDWSSVIWL